VWYLIFQIKFSEKIWCDRKTVHGLLLILDQLFEVDCKVCAISTDLDLLSSAVTTGTFCSCAFVLGVFKLSKLETKFCILSVQVSYFTGSLVKYRKGYFWSKSIRVNVVPSNS